MTGEQGFLSLVITEGLVHVSVWHLSFLLLRTKNASVKRPVRTFYNPLSLDMKIETKKFLPSNPNMSLRPQLE